MKAELLVLGVLHRGNFHPYEIKRRVSNAMVECYTDVDVGTLYYAVRRLAKDDLISPVSRERVARGGMRTVYGITAKGKRRFQELLREQFEAEGSVAATLYGAMLFLHLADLPTVAERGATPAQDCWTSSMRVYMIAKIRDTIQLKRRPRWPGTRIGACLGNLLCVFAAGQILAAAPVNGVSEETRRIDGPLPGLKLGLRHAFTGNPAAASRSEPLLILPGAAVPVSGNPDYPFTAGRSMMTALAQDGLDVWALDYYGFGASDRYPEMDAPANSHAALGNAQESADMVEAVVAFFSRERHTRSILLIGDSGGSLVAGVFATRHPEAVSRLILFGPVTPFTGGRDPKATVPAYDLITPQDLWSTFTAWSEEAGPPAALDSAAYQAWSEDYLRSDPTSRTRSPPSVRVPAGRQADQAVVASGRFVYDPNDIKAPTLIVMGEWDEIATFAGAEWLLHSLRHASSRKLVVLGHGSHTIQFEIEREQLYREMAAFLRQ